VPNIEILGIKPVRVFREDLCLGLLNKTLRRSFCICSQRVNGRNEVVEQFNPFMKKLSASSFYSPRGSCHCQDFCRGEGTPVENLTLT